MITEILKTYNEMLHSGKYSREECYNWLMEQRALHPEIPDFAFLYPEVVSMKTFDYLENDENKSSLFGDMSDIPTSCLQRIRDSVYGNGEYLNSPEYLKTYNAINAEIHRRLALGHIASKHNKRETIKRK